MVSGPFNPAVLWKRLRDSGMPEEAASSLVNEHIRRVRLARQVEETEKTVGYLSSLAGFSQGATLGFGDEIAGLAEAIPRMLPGGVSPKSAYAAGRDAARATNAQALASHPALFTGAAALGVAPALAATAGSGALAGLSPAVQGAIAGGTVGATQGLGMAEGSPANQALGAAEGAAFGAITGAVGGKVVEKVGPTVRQIAKNVRRVADPNAEARAAFRAQLEAAGVKGPALERTLAARFPARIPQPKVAKNLQEETAQQAQMAALESRRKAAIMVIAAREQPATAPGSSLAIRALSDAKQKAADGAAVQAVQEMAAAQSVANETGAMAGGAPARQAASHGPTKAQFLYRKFLVLRGQMTTPQLLDIATDPNVSRNIQDLAKETLTKRGVWNQ